MSIRQSSVVKEPTQIEEEVILIAFDGEVTEKIYMELLHHKRDELSIKNNLKFIIVDTINNHPKNIIKEINDNIEIASMDRIFIFMDIDRHFKDKIKYNECIEE